MPGKVTMTEEPGDGLAGTDCCYLGGVAPDLRKAVMAHCPGCQGTGACVMVEAIRLISRRTRGAPKTAVTLCHPLN